MKPSPHTCSLIRYGLDEGARVTQWYAGSPGRALHDPGLQGLAQRWRAARAHLPADKSDMTEDFTNIILGELQAGGSR